MSDVPKPDYARNMRILGHSDQGGRPDGVQVMVHRGFAYIGHMFSKGFSVIDVRDAKNPRPANFVAAPANTWNIHLQVHDDLLLVHPRQGHVRRAVRRRARLLQRRPWQDRRYRRSKAEARLERGPCHLRHFKTRRAAPDRLHAGRRRRHPPRLVHRRPLGLCLRAARRIYRLHLHDAGHEQPRSAARSGALVDSRHEPRGRRGAIMAHPRGATACITPSSTAIQPTPPGAMPAWWCSTLPTARSRN